MAAMHGNLEALHAEGNRTRRTIGVTDSAQSDATFFRRGGQFPKLDFSPCELHVVIFDVTIHTIGAGESRCKIENDGNQVGCRGAGSRARHHGARAAIGPRIMGDMIGIRLTDTNPPNRCIAHGRGDLCMNRGCSIAEFGGSDRELIVAVFGQPDTALRVMPTWRNGVDHPRRDTATDKPVGSERWLLRFCETLLHNVETLVESVAPPLDVMGFPTGRHP